jgi:hypothetical protein
MLVPFFILSPEFEVVALRALEEAAVAENDACHAARQALRSEEEGGGAGGVPDEKKVCRGQCGRHVTDDGGYVRPFDARSRIAAPVARGIHSQDGNTPRVSLS